MSPGTSNKSVTQVLHGLTAHHPQPLPCLLPQRKLHVVPISFPIQHNSIKKKLTSGATPLPPPKKKIQRMSPCYPDSRPWRCGPYPPTSPLGCLPRWTPPLSRLLPQSVASLFPKLLGAAFDLSWPSLPQPSGLQSSPCYLLDSFQPSLPVHHDTQQYCPKSCSQLPVMLSCFRTQQKWHLSEHLLAAVWVEPALCFPSIRPLVPSPLPPPQWDSGPWLGRAGRRCPGKWPGTWNIPGTTGPRSTGGDLFPRRSCVQLLLRTHLLQSPVQWCGN